MEESCFNCCFYTEMTIIELEMLKMSAAIREKENWAEDINDPKIVEEWKKEFCFGETDKATVQNRLKIFDYVVPELHYYISLRDGSIEVAGVYETWQSDDLIQETQRQRLMNGVKTLESAQMKNKDWLPGSNGQVWALVDPNLYSFVKGKTPVLRELRRSTRLRKKIFTFTTSPQNYGPLLNYSSDKARFMTHNEISQMLMDDLHQGNRLYERFPDYCMDNKFQWLPAEFQVDAKGCVKITSYINNLHPEIHSNLYRTIENVFQKFVPLFNKVLTYARCNFFRNRVTLETVQQSQFSDPVQICTIINSFSRPNAPEEIVNLAGSKLQVIVKLTNIELTPQNPEYDGGPWQVEGMANERIVATGIYYYSTQNITESRLLFRQSCSVYKFDEKYVESIYGLKDKDPENQNIGSIVTKEGRCITFPNTRFQHRVAPFQLKDCTRPGHQKMLVFHLVETSSRILSTDRVPPQQKSWFIHGVVKDPRVILPEEMVDKIVEMLDFPFNLKQAKEDRKELMEVREHFVTEFNERVWETKFNKAEAHLRYILKLRLGDSDDSDNAGFYSDSDLSDT